MRAARGWTRRIVRSALHSTDTQLRYQDRITQKSCKYCYLKLANLSPDTMLAHTMISVECCGRYNTLRNLAGVESCASEGE